MKVMVGKDFLADNVGTIQGILKKALKEEKAEPVFKAYVDCQSGAIVLSGEGKNLKAVRLRVVCLDETDEAKLEVLDEMSDSVFRCVGMSKEACQMLEQTVRIFNFAAKAFRATMSVHKVIHHLAEIQFQLVPVKITKDLVKEAWYRVDRIGAEKLLKGCIAGTYLFRRGEYADVLEKQLSESLGKNVQCLTVTFISDQNKISDLMLVNTAKGWQVYNDDPKLRGEVFSTLDQLLEKQNNLINFPLLHLKAA